MGNTLKNKYALITGSAGLLGVEHATALLNIGSNIILTDIDLVKIQALAANLSKLYPESKILHYQMDVTSEESIQAVLSNLKKQSIVTDILINNAAIDPKIGSDTEILEKSRLENFSLPSWNLQLAVGLTGSFLCSKYFGTYMVENNLKGIILNIASDLSVFSPDQRIYRKDGLPNEGQMVKPVTYSVIKTGLIGLTKYLSTYWCEQGIRVNALSPGGVFTSQPPEFVSKLTNLIPMGRMATHNEYHGCVQFLCTDASSYITGQNIVADGGRSVW